jgi:hypothetical protein
MTKSVSSVSRAPGARARRKGIRLTNAESVRFALSMARWLLDRYGIAESQAGSFLVASGTLTAPVLQEGAR